MIKKRNIRKYIILPSCLLILNAINEMIIYKLELISQPHLRTLVILLLFMFGFGLVGFTVSPLLEKWIETLYMTGRKKGGHLAEVMLLFSLFIALFFLYHSIYVGGVESVIPNRFHNTSIFP